jgi:hypothetical protein
MTRLIEVTVRLLSEREDEPDDLARLTTRLRAELLDTEAATVEPVTGQTAPQRAKGLGTLVGWLVVRLTTGGIRVLIGALQQWASRNQRMVEVSYGGDTLKVTGATTGQQEKIIDDWIARHTPGA